MSDIRLLVDGTLYGGWKSVNVLRSISYAANTFSLGLTDRWSDTEERRPIRMGSPCEVWAGEEKLITGYVDEVGIGYNHQSRSIEVNGRSKTADLIDCALIPSEKQKTQYNNQTLPGIAATLSKLFGIAVVDEVGLSNRKTMIFDVGETVYEFLSRRANTEAVFLTTNPEGDLVIARAGNKKLRTALELGKNVLSANGLFSMKDRFSHYGVTAQQRWGNDDTSGAAVHVAGKTEDVLIRYRPTVNNYGDTLTLAEAGRIAEWSRNVSYGRSMQATYTVSGWHHDDGLWAPNHLVKIVDEWMGIDAYWLISEVRLLLDEHGTRTELTVAPREAFDLVSLPSTDGISTWS